MEGVSDWRVEKDLMMCDLSAISSFCSPISQNKNWILFGAIANEMCDPESHIEQVDLKLFVKGMDMDTFNTVKT